MESPILNELRTILGHRVHPGEPLAKHTHFRIGGPADFLAEVTGRAELAQVLSVARNHGLPIYILGNGSNLLVADTGVRGLVLTLGGELATVARAGHQLVAGGGLKLPKLAQVAAQAGLSGVEFACNIPGTVGAGLAINAGAHGGDLSQVVQEATILWPDGQLETVPKEAMGLRYRGSSLAAKGAVVVDVTFTLTPAEPEACLAKIKELLEQRRRTQPLGQATVGSTFKNPPGDYAGRLLEGAGVKGLRVGQAQVSEKHANFILNLGGATAHEVLTLMQQMHRAVATQFGVRLEPEVKLWGAEYPF